MAARSAIINVIAKACYKAARPGVRAFGEVANLQVSRKGPGDFVSKADIRTDRILREELAFARPDFGFLTEEDAPVESTNFEGQRWIIDPLDGTANFLHGIPFFAISVGLEQKGEMVAGVIYDPLRDELFHAERGKGAYLNDQRVRVSGRQHLTDCALATSHSFVGKPHSSDSQTKPACDVENRHPPHLTFDWSPLLIPKASGRTKNTVSGPPCHGFETFSASRGEPTHWRR